MLTGRTASSSRTASPPCATPTAIVVVEDGRIVEEGTYAELLAHGGAFARLHAAQFDVA